MSKARTAPAADAMPVALAFDKFTARARAAMAAAQQQARQLRQPAIAPEHLLLGLLLDEESMAAQALQALGVSRDAVRAAVLAGAAQGSEASPRRVGLTPPAKQAVALAVEEARAAGHHYLGTEHLILGLVREGHSPAAQALAGQQVTLDALRGQIHLILASGGPAEEAAAQLKSNVVMCRLDDHDLAAIDTLIEAGIRPTRSDAAAWLIHAGLEANRGLLEALAGTVTEIRRLRAQAQTLAQEIGNDSASSS
ncbi:MAG TPA: Clp protease N-terminal domain-containing protein [Chloroflexia bacterium]|nr:Clp protease N-terminal domain-containing protein [Chloroflexia bacterium]